MTTGTFELPLCLDEGGCGILGVDCEVVAAGNERVRSCNRRSIVDSRSSMVSIFFSLSGNLEWVPQDQRFPVLKHIKRGTWHTIDAKSALVGAAPSPEGWFDILSFQFDSWSMAKFYHILSKTRC